MVWISNYHIVLIAHPYPNFDGGLANQQYG